MPILAIYVLIAAALFSAGLGAGYTYEHAQVKLCEASIESANNQASTLLAARTAEVEKLNSAQTITNVTLETEHVKNIKLINTSNTALDNARRVWASHQTSCGNALSKINNTGIDKKDDDGGYYLSAAELTEELDKLIPKALRADRIDADLHYTLTWLRSLPPELIE